MPGARVFLLGEARELAPSLAARDWSPVDVDDPDAFAFDEGSAEAAVLVGVLERTEWDRWLLQRVHRALAPNARLVLAAADAMATIGPGDLGYLYASAMKVARLKLTGRPGAFHSRRYRRDTLLRSLDTLGFAIDGWDESTAKELRTVARRLPSIFGLHATRPFPDPVAFRARYEQEHADFLATRDTWVREHPAWVAAAGAQPLDLEPLRGASVLVLAPHPDDELIGCGGTTAALMRAGAQVHVVQATDGADAASLWRAPESLKRTVRLEEAGRVAGTAGYASIEYWTEPNEAFRMSEGNVARLRTTLARVGPRLLLVPFVSDVHEDHRTLAALLARALEENALAGVSLPDAQVASYEVWGHVPANGFCDVTAEMPRLERLLWLYETAMKVDDYVHFCAERNHYNALAVAGRNGFVEAFHVVSAPHYPELVRASGILS